PSSRSCAAAATTRLRPTTARAPRAAGTDGGGCSRHGTGAGGERLGSARGGSAAPRPACVADARSDVRAASRARRAHADAGALRRAGADPLAPPRLDGDRRPRSAVTAEPVRLPGLGAVMAARPAAARGTDGHGDGEDGAAVE